MPSRLRERLPLGTLRFRLAVWNTVVVLAMTVAALIAARYAARATLFDAADAELRGGVREVALAIDDLFPDMDAVVAEMRRRAVGQEQRGWFSQLLTQDGRTLWRSPDCPDDVAAVRPFNLDRVENVVQVGPYRYVRQRITSKDDQPVFHVRVGTYTTGLDASLRPLVRLLTILGGVLCGLTPLAGWWLAVRSTRPITAILETADRLEPTRLADRLPVRGVGDELDHLAVTINGLLDDVAAHVERQQDFLADAAHELRGPLAALQSSVEVALAHERDAAAYREALAVVLDEARSLAKLTNGLLLLAESGAESVPVAAAPVNLADVVRQAAAMFSGAAEDRGVAIAVADSTDQAVAGDPGQIRQVVGNLLDNAIRFTPPGGRIDVAVAHRVGGDRVTLTVTDSGRGIGAEHLPRLFDRFYKVDPSRARDGDSRSGGLGLPICKAIVERHGGTIAVTSRVGQGTTVTVDLPAAAASPPALLQTARPRAHEMVPNKRVAPDC